jgi:hypothetical protein
MLTLRHRGAGAPAMLVARTHDRTSADYTSRASAQVQRAVDYRPFDAKERSADMGYRTVSTQRPRFPGTLK